MAVIEGGVTAALQEIESATLAGRSTQRPSDVGARGAYSFGQSTGVIAAGLGANSEIFQFRWSHATLIAVPRSVRISAAVSTTAFIAGVPPQLELRVARGWTGQGTGGTGITFGVNDGKKRSNFAQSAMAAGDLRIATTAALGAGTKTLDGFAVASLSGNGGVATGTTQMFPPGTYLWERNTGDEWPFVFLQNQGFVIRSVEIPGTGTWKLAAIIEWSEYDPAVITGWT